MVTAQRRKVFGVVAFFQGGRDAVQRLSHRYQRLHLGGRHQISRRGIGGLRLRRGVTGLLAPPMHMAILFEAANKPPAAARTFRKSIRKGWNQ